MSNKISIVLLIAFLITVPAFSNPDNFQKEKPIVLIIPEFSVLSYYGVVTENEVIVEPEILVGLRNNRFFLESLRLTRLAMETYEYGDYDASAEFAEEAIRKAGQSDEYVAEHLIVEARRLLNWADANDIESRNPIAYNDSWSYFNESQTAFEDGDWNAAIAAATRSINILTLLQSGDMPLPGQYTVRTWANEKDCLWNIAGYSWVYGNPWRWRELYNANKSRMPEPNNPNLIEPGFVLEIPSINGEARQGMWDPAAAYER